MDTKADIATLEQASPQIMCVYRRFAETVVTSDVTNNANVGREARFDMLLPKAAFITAIRIELQNETIHGVIEEKERAKKIFDRVWPT